MCRMTTAAVLAGSKIMMMRARNGRRGARDLVVGVELSSNNLEEEHSPAFASIESQAFQNTDTRKARGLSFPEGLESTP